MSPRGKRWLKISAALYGLMLALYVYAMLENRDRVSLPSFPEDAVVKLPAADAADLDSRIAEIAGAGYRSREAVKGVVVDGQKLTTELLHTLVEKKRQVLYVYDPVHLRRLADANLRSGKDYVVDGKMLVRLGDPLDVDALCLLVFHYDTVTDGAGQIYVQGHEQLWGIDLTILYTWLNLLALLGILYGLFWQPVRKLITERSQRIAQEVQEAEKAREDAEILRNAMEGRLARLGGAAVGIADPRGARAPVRSSAGAAPDSPDERLVAALRQYLDTYEFQPLNAEAVQVRDEVWKLLQTLQEHRERAETEARASGIIGAVDVGQAAPPLAGDGPAGPARETPEQGDPDRADTDTQSPPYSASAD